MEKSKISMASYSRPYAFGDNRLNACGTMDETTASFIYIPTRVQDFKSISAGFYHSLGIDKNGVLFSWGKNKFKQLGRENEQELVPRPVEGIINKVVISKIACGWQHSMALTPNGFLFAWGLNVHG